MKKIYSLLYIGVLLSFVLSSCGDDAYEKIKVQERVDQNLNAYTQQRSDLTLFYEALQLTGLGQDLSGKDYTVFAPNNAAMISFMSKYGWTKLEDVPVQTLTNVLKYHVLSSKFLASELQSGERTTLHGEALGLTVSGNKVSINGKSSVIDANIAVTDAVIHVVNLVAEVPTMNIVEILQAKTANAGDEEAPSFEILIYAATKAGMLEDLASTKYTLFAPSDVAFAKIDVDKDVIDALPVQVWADIIKFHILEGVYFVPDFEEQRIFTLLGPANTQQGIDITVGDGLTLNGVDVVEFNLNATNGVVHVLDEVLTAVPTLARTLNFLNANLPRYYETSLFYAGVVYVGYVDKFSYEERNSLLVPSNLALQTYFTEIGVSGWSDLSVEDAKKLVDRHIFPAQFKLGSVTTGSKITNILGETFYVTRNKYQGIFINGQFDPYGSFSTAYYAHRIGASGYLTTYNDWETYNGRLTTINRVLKPLPAATIADVLTSRAAELSLDSLLVAVQHAGLTDRLKEANITLLAPTNEAFIKYLEALNVTGIKKINATTLSAVLLNHVIKGVEFQPDLRNALNDKVLTTLGTKQLRTTSDAAGLKISVYGDVYTTTFAGYNTPANNGVIHRINDVLIDRPE